MGNMQRGATRPDKDAPRRDWLNTALRAAIMLASATAAQLAAGFVLMPA